jgi:hypothetical protein
MGYGVVIHPYKQSFSSLHNAPPDCPAYLQGRNKIDRGDADAQQISTRNLSLRVREAARMDTILASSRTFRLELDYSVPPCCVAALAFLVTKIPAGLIGKVATCLVRKIAAGLVRKVTASLVSEIAACLIGKVTASLVSEITTSLVGEVAACASGKVLSCGVGGW